MIAPTTNYVIQACRKDTIAYPEPMRIGEHYLIDSDSGILFVTFETFFGTPVIELVNARTMTSAGNVEAESASNLAGIILDYLDPNTVHLYTVDRGTNKLFVYDWDAQEKELELITFNGQDYYELEPKDPNMVSQVKAGGLAFDPETATLYVSQFWGGGGGFHYSQYVHAFERDPNGSYFYPRRTIDLGEDNYAVDIDVDSENGWLYAGGFNYDENSHNNLIRFDLEEENPEAETEDIGAGVIGLAVCQGTSYVYMTTYNYKLEAWDTDLPWGMGWGQIDAEDIVAGAGVCVAEVDYVEPFRLDKRDDVTDCVDPLGDGLVTYTIEPNYVWDQEGDPMLLDGVEVVDYLPEEVDFESASDGGQYEAASHTVKWVVDPNDLLDGVSFTLEVSLNRKATPWRSFTNVGEISGTISGREYSAQTSVVSQ